MGCKSHDPALSFLFAVKWDLMSDHLVFPLKWKHGSYATGRGAIGSKTSKILVLPEFCKIERGGGGSSGGSPPCYRGLIWLGHTCRAGGAPDQKGFHPALRAFPTRIIEILPCVSMVEYL